MKRATLHIIINSICCAKIKGVDKDGPFNGLGTSDGDGGSGQRGLGGSDVTVSEVSESD